MREELVNVGDWKGKDTFHCLYICTYIYCIVIFHTYRLYKKLKLNFPLKNICISEFNIAADRAKKSSLLDWLVEVWIKRYCTIDELDMLIYC